MHRIFFVPKNGTKIWPVQNFPFLHRNFVELRPLAAPAQQPPTHAQNTKIKFSPLVRIVYFSVSSSFFDHGGRRTSMIGHLPHLRHGKNHHENSDGDLDDSQELILPLGEQVPR